MHRRAFTTLCMLAVLAAPARGEATPAFPLVARIDLPGVSGRIDHLSLDPRDHHLYVAALGSGEVDVVDMRKRRRVARITPFGAPQGVIVVPSLHRVVVTDATAGRATIIDTRTLEREGEVQLPDDGDNVRRDPHSDHVWFGAGSGETAALLEADVVRGRVLRRIRLPGHPESFRLAPDGGRIYVNVPRDSAVEVVDRTAGRVVARWPLPAAANFPMALDDGGHRLFVATRDPARLIVLDTRSGKILESVPTVADADDIHFDRARDLVYVSGGAGMVEVHDAHAPTLARTASIRTRRGARTSLFVPALHRLIVALPASGPLPAQLRIYDTGR
ncbi:MAG: hypothetical protein GC151_11990 [Betaproteobacteria bacterium]|nr:hypothetical protein [Betaproteobacteria bacterium]